MSIGAMRACNSDSALMKAWSTYQEADGFKDSLYWATTQTVMRRERAQELGIHPDDNRASAVQREQYAKGALWAAFMAGFLAATERAASLHENVRPASDDERHAKVPGAGAMGAVIEYRDLIRADVS